MDLTREEAIEVLGDRWLRLHRKEVVLNFLWFLPFKVAVILTIIYGEAWPFWLQAVIVIPTGALGLWFGIARMHSLANKIAEQLLFEKEKEEE